MKVVTLMLPDDEAAELISIVEDVKTRKLRPMTSFSSDVFVVQPEYVIAWYRKYNGLTDFY
jgi:hypothetical protein